jgi:hypothetical protein
VAPQGARNDQVKQGITQNESDEDATQKQEDTTRNCPGGETRQCDYESEEQDGQDVAPDDERL